jgi:ribosomal protein uL13
MIVNGENAILGRLGAKVAKELLAGNPVQIVNAEKIVVSGAPTYFEEKLRERRNVTNKRNPENKSKWPRVSHMLVRRIIRGMLPYKHRQSGRDAFHRLTVSSGVPEGVDISSATTYKDATAHKLRKSTTVLEVCRHFGYNG